MERKKDLGLQQVGKQFQLDVVKASQKEEEEENAFETFGKTKPDRWLFSESEFSQKKFFFLKAEKQREDKRTSWISFKTIRSDLRVSSLAASTRPMRTSDLRGVRWGMKAHSNLRDWWFLRLFWPLGHWGSIMRKKNCFFPYRGSSHFTKFFPTSSF